MRMLSVTDLAIALAIKAGTLSVRECEGRFGPFLSIEDAYGIIEVALDEAEAEARLAAIAAAMQVRHAA